MSYAGLGATDEIGKLNAAVKRNVAGGGRQARLEAVGFTLTTRSVDDLVTKFRKTKAGQVVFSSGQAVTNLGKAIKQIKSGKMDASGIANVAQNGFAMFENIAAIVSMGNTKAAAEISKWAKVGVNCSAGIVAAGPWGGLTCGLQVLSNFLDYVFGGEHKEDWKTPRTIFVPDRLSVPLIAADASRLASVLKYYYGVESYQQLYQRLLGHEEFLWLYGSESAGGYPDVPKMDAEGRVVAQDDTSLPGHNLRTILQILSLGMGASAALNNVRDGLAAVAGWRHGSFDPPGRGLYRRYEWDQDINHHAIGTAAYWGRMASAASQDLRVNAVVMASGDTEGWNRQSLGGGRATFDARSFIIVDELINFFGAVTRREVTTEGVQGARSIADRYGFGSHTPTKHLYVSLQDRRGESENVGTSYSKRCWTNLQRSTGHNCSLQSKVGAADNAALRDFGTVRLMAAFSFLHQSYLWSSRYADRRWKLDPIRIIAKPTGTAIDELLTPVDPRTVLGTGLHPNEVPPTAGHRAPVLQRASTRVFSVSGTMANSRTWDPSIGYAPAVALPLKLEQKINQEQAALQRGLRKAPTSQQKTWFLPDVAVRQAQRAMEQAGAGSGLMLRDPFKYGFVLHEPKKSGAGGVVLLGAAALLAMKFLK